MRTVPLFVLLSLALSQRAHAGPSKDPIAPYVGDWVAVGWGTEVRFKQSRKEFVRQLAGGRNVPGQTGEETIMSLTVKHAAEFAFTVLPDGTVRGRGAVAYALFPNLCGVAALTEQVNKAVNMMDKIPFVFQLASELGKGVIGSLHADWYAKEAELANSLTGWRLDHAEGAVKSMGAKDKASMQALHITAWLRDHEPDEVVDLAKTVIKNRCNTGAFTFLAGFSCTILGSTPVAQEVEKFGELLFGKAMDSVWELSGDRMIDKLKALDLEGQRDMARCQLGSGAAMHAGAQVGPADAKELAKEMAPELAKAALESAVGGGPVGLMLAIPGVTQVQYLYKGFPKGPEKRLFKIKGKLVAYGDGPRLELAMDGDVEGDTRLAVEYQVNYKTDRATFPAWSPFRKTGARVWPSGTITLHEDSQTMQTRTFTDEATGKTMTTQIPLFVTKLRKLESNLPFAAFEETGIRRDNVKPWHDYAYYWTAIKVTGLGERITATVRPEDLE